MQHIQYGLIYFFCRNEMLSKKVGSDQLPIVRKTGTTIVGMIFKVPFRVSFSMRSCLITIPDQDGVVLGADTRATAGPIVADKNCEKIHYLTENIYCCGAGTSADCEYTTGCGLAFMFSSATLTRTFRGHLVGVGTSSSLNWTRDTRCHCRDHACQKAFPVHNHLPPPFRPYVLKPFVSSYQGHISTALVIGGVDATGKGVYILNTTS